LYNIHYFFTNTMS